MATYACLVVGFVLCGAIIWWYGGVYDRQGDPTPEPSRPGVGRFRLPGTFTPQDALRARVPNRWQGTLEDSDDDS